MVSVQINFIMKLRVRLKWKVSMKVCYVYENDAFKGNMFMYK